MADDLLITIAELESAARVAPGSYQDDPFAVFVIEGYSTLVRDYGDPDWTAATVPSRVKLIVRMRSAEYVRNPSRNIAESIAGGPSERKTEDAVRGFSLSSEEIDVIAKLADVDSPNVGTLSTVSLSQGRGPGEVRIDHVPDEYGLCLVDGPQMAGGDWWIPLTTSSDPGGPLG